MYQGRNASNSERNEAIWHANRELGVGTAKLADQYRLSRQRIKQIIARQEQLHAMALGDSGPSRTMRTEVDGHV